MRSLLIFALISVVAAKPTPGGLYGGYGGGYGGYGGYASYGGYSPALSSVSLVHQPVQHVAVSQPIVHAAHAVAYAKPAATSYSSFQQVVHPVAQHVVHAAPVFHGVSQPVVHATQVHAAPVFHTVAHAPVSYGSAYGSYGLGSYGHGW